MKSNKDHDHSLRQHLKYLLSDGGAHAKFSDVVSSFPAKLRGQKPAAFPHSAWMLLEHMRIAQRDILENPPSEAAWSASIKALNKDLQEMRALVANPRTDLFARIPWGDGQTILREALLVADHNAYHLGQLVDVRRLLGAWPEE